MKICVLTHTFPKYLHDTTAAFMHPFVLGLIQAGYDVVVITPFHQKLNTSDFPYRIVTYKYIWPNSFHRLGYSQTLSKGVRIKIEIYLLAPFLYFFGFLTLLRLLVKENFDIVSAHWILPNGFIMYLTSLFISVPYVVTLAGSDVFVANKNFLFSFMARLAAKKAAAICADSPQYIKELSKVGVHPDNSHIIPYPVDTSQLKISNSLAVELKKKLGIPPSSIMLLAVGRLIYKKGFSYLLDAFAKVIKKEKNVRLIIVGDGDLKQILEQHSKKLQISQSVIFVGNIERNAIGAYYTLADIFIMPSIKDQEGNIDDRPVALLEAISCGKPVIATNFPGNALSVQHSVSGFLVPQKNSKIISERIIQLARSKELRTRMGKQAEKIASSSLVTKSVGEKYNILFKDILKNE